MATRKAVIHGHHKATRIPRLDFSNRPVMGLLESGPKTKRSATCCRIWWPEIPVAHSSQRVVVHCLDDYRSSLQCFHTHREDSVEAVVGRPPRGTTRPQVRTRRLFSLPYTARPHWLRRGKPCSHSR